MEDAYKGVKDVRFIKSKERYPLVLFQKHVAVMWSYWIVGLCHCVVRFSWLT